MVVLVQAKNWVNIERGHSVCFTRLGMVATICHAVAQANSKKGEDAPAAIPSDGTTVGAYAIFDGHGGRDFSHTLGGLDNGPDHSMLPKLLEAGGNGLPSQEQIEEVFWQMDEKLGAMLASRANPIHNGSTAQVLLVQPDASGAMQCVQAWVGDSTALTIDMKRGVIIDSTFNHNPGEGDESERLLHMAAVNKACRKILKAEAKERGEAPKEEEDDDDAGKEAIPSPELILRVLNELGHSDRSEAHIAALRKAFEREKLILKHVPSGGKYRRQCFIYKRPPERDANEPLTVHTTKDYSTGHHADMMMTRSLGDWKHVAWILPLPMIKAYTVPADGYRRVVLASDGLWDVVPLDKALRLVCRIESVQDAAEALLEEAKRVYFEERKLELPGDDTTVMVVDLNPSQMPLPGLASVGCCSIM
jgi:serine/threonine protein phosphatase PrpC